MTGVTINEFNTYFSNQYPALVTIAKRIDNQLNTGNGVVYQNDYKDALHTTYERVERRLQNNIFNGNISGYTSVVLRNVLIDQRKDYNRDTMDIEDNEMLLDEILRNKEEEIESTNQYQDQIREITRYIFQYLARLYDDKEIFIFRCYMTTKGSTYKKIAAITGYSKSFVGECVKKMKMDLRENLLVYIKNNS